MTNLKRIKTIWFIAAMVVFTFLCSCNKKEAPPEKPNILFIFTDDQRADALGVAGNTYINTPNIDKLADNGIRFTNTYVMGGHHGAVCAPSRAMLMSGTSLYHLYSGFDMNTWVDDKVLDGVTTMPMYFAQYGYETFGTGKWHNGANSFEASFKNGSNVFIGGMCDHFNVPCRELGPDGKLGEPVVKGYSTDLFAGAAVDFINDFAAGNRDEPFFCYIAFTAPHDPRSPQEDYIGMYPDDAIPLPGNFMNYHPFEFDRMNIRDENLGAWPRTPEMVRASIAEYYALISHIDDKIGEIIDILKNKGLYENTIIVYAGDNGLGLGSHGLLGKQNLYEHSTNVPLIITGPGISKEKQSEALVYLYDLFPTLCDLSGLPVPEGIDGKDIAPIVKGDAEGVRESLFTVYRNTVRAVRDNEWKLIRYPDRDYTQLFNLKDDPLELNNLAGDSKYQSKIDELNVLMKDWQKTAGDTTSLTAGKILPMDYNPLDFVRKPDPHQPEYILKKYFKGIDTSKKDFVDR